MVKKILPILLSLAVIFAVAVPASANDNNDLVSPYYLYTSSVTCQLLINNKTATCKSILEGSSTVSKIDGTHYLEKKDGKAWETVTGCTWSNTTNTDYLKLENTKGSLSSGTYRVRAVFTVYCGGKSETVEVTSNEVSL